MVALLLINRSSIVAARYRFAIRQSLWHLNIMQMQFRDIKCTTRSNQHSLHFATYCRINCTRFLLPFRCTIGRGCVFRSSGCQAKTYQTYAHHSYAQLSISISPAAMPTFSLIAWHLSVFLYCIRTSICAVFTHEIPPKATAIARYLSLSLPESSSALNEK